MARRTNGASRPGGEDGEQLNLGQTGLRGFSALIWERLLERRSCKVNDVANELIQAAEAEAAAAQGCDLNSRSINRGSFDQRNVRRRVYDALNVMGAMGIIVKDDKMVSLVEPSSWGAARSAAAAPASHQSSDYSGVDALDAEVEQKRRVVRELVLQQLAQRRLAQRNYGLTMQGGGTAPEDKEVAVYLPFVAIATSDDAVVSIDYDASSVAKKDVHIAMDCPFVVHTCDAILRELRFEDFSPSEIAELVPAHLLPYMRMPQQQHRDSRSGVGHVAAASSASIPGDASVEEDDGGHDFSNDFDDGTGTQSSSTPPMLAPPPRARAAASKRGRRAGPSSEQHSSRRVVSPQPLRRKTSGTSRRAGVVDTQAAPPQGPELAAVAPGLDGRSSPSLSASTTASVSSSSSLSYASQHSTRCDDAATTAALR